MKDGSEPDSTMHVDSMLDGHQHLGRRNCFCLPGGEAMSPIPFRPELNSSQDVTHWNPSFGEVFWEMSFGRTTVEWSAWFSWGSSCFCGCRKGACCRSQGDAKVRMTVIAQISMLIYINLGEDATSSFGMKRYQTAPRDSLQIPLQPLNKILEGHRHRSWQENIYRYVEATYQTLRSLTHLLFVRKNICSKIDSSLIQVVFHPWWMDLFCPWRNWARGSFDCLMLRRRNPRRVTMMPLNLGRSHCRSHVHRPWIKNLQRSAHLQKARRLWQHLFGIRHLHYMLHQNQSSLTNNLQSIKRLGWWESCFALPLTWILYLKRKWKEG